MRFYYPQAAIQVSATVQLTRTRDELRDVTFLCRPRSLTVEKNDYNTADVLSVELDASKFPILPRLIRQVHLQAYAGDAGALDSDAVLDDAMIRFIGYVDEPEMSLSEDDGRITWKARDYTGLLLDTKRPSTDIVPRYSDNLKTALRRILDTIPGGDNILLRLDGLDEWPNIADGVLSGLKDAKIPAKPEDTAWHLIKRACDPLALIPRIELDELVIGTSRGLFQPSRRPVFMYGRNVSEYSEKRKLTQIKEGIGLSGYSLADKKQITAIYPPAGDRQIAKSLKKPAVRKHAKPPPSIAGTTDKRKWFPYGAVANQEALDEAAEALFNQRSRQEFEGSLTTHGMLCVDDLEMLDGVTEPDFDVTGLGNGDRVMVAIEPEYRAMLGGLPTTEARVQLLIDDGYDDDVASALVAAWETHADGGLEVYVKTASHHYSEDGYSLQIAFLNLLTDAAA